MILFWLHDIETSTWWQRATEQRRLTMARNIVPPEQFNFQKPEQWARWKKRFEQYRQASALAEDGVKRQVNTLLYCMGQDSDEILQAQGVTEDELADYGTVVGKFDEYFQVRANPIYERARLSK